MTTPTRPEFEAAAYRWPHPASPQVSDMLDTLLAEYDYPSNPKNAARVGYMAAQRIAAAMGWPTVPEQAVGPFCGVCNKTRDPNCAKCGQWSPAPTPKEPDR